MKREFISLDIDEEETEDEIPYIDPETIIYKPGEQNKLDLQLDKVLEQTFEAVQLKKGNIRRKTYDLLQKSTPFIKDVLSQLFWIVQLNIYHPEDDDVIRMLTKDMSNMWLKFCFPLQTGNEVESKVIDRFFFCFPYFMTQALQDIFIRITFGHPSVMERSFRMKVCSLVVQIFSGVQPIDTLLKTRLGSFFHKPPQADIPEVPKQRKEPEDVLLPIEDIDTLIDMHRRKRPCDTTWRIGHISPLFAESTKRETIPFTHDACLHVQLPQGGEDDWTINLPPLLPKIPKRQVIGSVQDYHPNNETRSLLNRARRPALMPDHKSVVNEFKHNEKERVDRLSKNEVEMQESLQKVRAVKEPVLSQFVTDLRVLQLEKKFGEDPEWGTDNSKSPIKQPPPSTSTPKESDTPKKISAKASFSSVSTEQILSGKTPYQEAFILPSLEEIYY